MNISICGLGVMGNNHLNICKKLNFNIISTYDPKNNDDYNLFLNTLKKSHGLIISSPTNQHIKNILDALKINPNIKILCEKPIAFSSIDDRLYNIKKFSSSIMIGHIERFNNAFITLKKYINNKNIIQIKTKRVSNIPSRENIHCKLDIGIHDIDLCCNICDSYPDSVQILSNKLYTHENLIYIINTTQIINEISWNYSYKSRCIQILTDDGEYSCDLLDQKIIFTNLLNQQIIIPVEKKESLILELLEFREMCLNNKASISTIENNLNLLKLMGY